MPKLTDYEFAARIGTRDGWIDALDYVLTVLNEEIDYQEESVSGSGRAASALYRLQTIFSHRREEWMLHG